MNVVDIVGMYQGELRLDFPSQTNIWQNLHTNTHAHARAVRETSEWVWRTYRFLLHLDLKYYSMQRNYGTEGKLRKHQGKNHERCGVVWCGVRYGAAADLELCGDLMII